MVATPQTTGAHSVRAPQDRRTEEAWQLIRAADGAAGELDAAIAGIGADRVAELAVDELVFRCDPPVNTTEVLLQLHLRHHGWEQPFTLSIERDRPITVYDGEADGACMRLGFELADLIRQLYGPAVERPAGTHAIELLGDTWAARRAADKNALRAWMRAIGQATELIAAALSDRVPHLNRLAAQYGSDKWGLVHWFTPHYDRHFRDLRDRAVRVLEIGIGGYEARDAGGRSLLMWKRYFRRGLILGLDIFPKDGLDGLRLTTVRADQGDPEQLVEVARRFGPFDVIIDDGSHLNEHIRISFAALFPHVNPGGVYVIEDLWTSYCAGFGGDDTDLQDAETGLTLLKDLVDDLHHQERSAPSRGYSAEHTVGLHVYHNVAFVEKGVNAEGGIPPWVPHSFDQLVPQK